MRIGGVPEESSVLGAADRSWPLVRVSVEPTSTVGGAEWLGRTKAQLVLRTGGSVALDREAGTAIISTSRRIAVDELAHPLLAPIAAVMAHWLGRESLHAGAFLGGDGAWAILGSRNAGKSSTLARLALDGQLVLCDDMLVVDGTTAFAGPRAIDLREQTADALKAGESIGHVGARNRWRLRLGDAPSSVPLRGWFVAAWGDRVDATPLSPADRLETLLANRGVNVPPLAHDGLLTLAELPGWRVVRPHRLDSLQPTAELIAELAGL